MISPLSSHLLGCHGIALGARSDESSDMQHTEPNSQNGSCSGYSADKEASIFGSPPVLIDLTSSRSCKRKLSGDSQRSKRRKIDERNFAAASASIDLARAGLPYPKIMTTRSRIIPSLDLSGVQLVSAKSVEASPFLHSVSTGLSSGGYDILTDFGATYADLLAQSAPMYYQPAVVTPCRCTSLNSGDTSLKSCAAAPSSEGQDTKESLSSVKCHMKACQRALGDTREVNNATQFTDHLVQRIDLREEQSSERRRHQSWIPAQVMG